MQDILELQVLEIDDAEEFGGGVETILPDLPSNISILLCG